MTVVSNALAFFTGGIGGWELAVVFLAVLVLFGPKRLPEIARSIGRVMHQLRRASQDFHDQLMHVEHDARTDIESSLEGMLEPSESHEEGAPVGPDAETDEPPQSPAG